MAYIDTFNASRDPSFQGRCLAALWSVAQDIIAEDPQTANHAARRAYAVSVLRGQQTITLEMLAVQVLRNTTVASNPTTAADGDIKFVLVSQIADLLEIG